MKLLQNKSTGEIGCLECSFGKTPEKITVAEYIGGRRGSKVWYYDSLAELNKEWEDAPEEPKHHWHIRDGEVYESGIEPCRRTEMRKSIGNYFATKEEAEKAVEKLKALQRLKDKGFEFTSFAHIGADGWVHGQAKFILPQDRLDDEAEKDLGLLLGGEK